jgi:hypothetical protein
MIIGRSSTNFLFFYADRKFKMAATAGHRLTLEPMGKCVSIIQVVSKKKRFETFFP